MEANTSSKALNILLAKTVMSHSTAILRGGTLDSWLNVYRSGPGSALNNDSSRDVTISADPEIVALPQDCTFGALHLPILSRSTRVAQGRLVI